MMFRTCSREREVSQALHHGHWPEGCLPELRTHVENCPSCGDLVLLTQTFQQARKQSEQESSPVAPGLLWWRAQLRQRVTATKRVNEPITIAQIFAFVTAICLPVVLAASQYRQILRGLSEWTGVEPSRGLHPLSSSVTATTWNFAMLLPGFVGLFVLGGVVAYAVWKES